MRVTEIAFTAYPMTNLARARRFYEDILGLVRSRMFGTQESGFVEYDISAGTLLIGNMAAPHWKPSTGRIGRARSVAPFICMLLSVI